MEKYQKYKIIKKNTPIPKKPIKLFNNDTNEKQVI